MPRMPLYIYSYSLHNIPIPSIVNVSRMLLQHSSLVFFGKQRFDSTNNNVKCGEETQRKTHMQDSDMYVYVFVLCICVHEKPAKSHRKYEGERKKRTRITANR